MNANPAVYVPAADNGPSLSFPSPPDGSVDLPTFVLPPVEVTAPYPAKSYWWLILLVLGVLAYRIYGRKLRRS